MTKYETLNGEPIETNEEGWLADEDVAIGPWALVRLAELGWIRERKLTVQELFDRTPNMPYNISDVAPESCLYAILERIIDLDLIDQFIND